jgi:hypothetical protein
VAESSGVFTSREADCLAVSVAIGAGMSGRMKDKGVSRKTMKGQTISAYWGAGFRRSVVCLTVLVYLGLVALAASCASMPVAQSKAHHHSHESAHSPLCAWSCQMVSQSGLVASSPSLLVSLVEVSAAVALVHSYWVVPPISRPARAPPMFTLG